MASTRDFNSLGVWAKNADIVIPAEPIPGTAYRDETTTEGTNETGEAFATDPNSATFNQRLFIISSFTDLMNTHGIVGWSDAVDYDIPAIVFADDGKFYYALQASGPNTPALAKDPPTAPTFWEEAVTKQLLAETTGASLIGTEPAGDPVSRFMPHAWAARVEADGTFNNSTNSGITSIANPDDGRYIITLNVPLTPSAERFVTITTLTNIEGGEDAIIAAHNQIEATASTLTVETFDDNGNLVIPEGESGFSVMIYFFG